MTVVIAKRLCDRAREGQIFVSDGVRAGGADVAGDMSVASRLVEMFGGLYPG
jgi:class 3 adenylate cyclase